MGGSWTPVSLAPPPPGWWWCWTASGKRHHPHQEAGASGVSAGPERDPQSCSEDGRPLGLTWMLTFPDLERSLLLLVPDWMRGQEGGRHGC